LNEPHDNLIHFTGLHPLFIERIRERQQAIHAWLGRYEGSKELPLYSSVDIRDAGFKMAVVDTNIFPAGFNNLCEHGLEDSVRFIREAIWKRVPQCQRILIIAEEHTRNTWYLENVRILEDIIQRAGFQAKIATFLTEEENGFCEKSSAVDLETATGQKVTIYCFQTILKAIEQGTGDYDLIIMNNDLIGGIPEILKKSRIPIYPSIQAGWHSRLKSHHFCHTGDLIREFAKLVDLDPWFFSALYAVVDRADINHEQDRLKLKETAVILFDRIQQKYNQHHITEKPYIVMKTDAGTYGMGVMMINDPQEIIQLNRHNRNKLSKGKSASVINRFLLQEGVPTIYNIDHEISEVCIYQVESNLVGGFYRSHADKGERDNLNVKGMVFKKMCPHLKKYGDCGVHHDISIFDVYRILARIAAIAAHREIIQLEARQQ
jgi:glutamate--cysteine ligase